MKDFSLFVRYVTNGSVYLHAIFFVFSSPFLYWIYNSPTSCVLFFTVICPMIGILVEPFTRKHRCGKDVEYVYMYIRLLTESKIKYDIYRNLVKEIGENIEEKTYETSKEIFYSIISKSIYESFIFTFSGTDSYTKRVDQQVRLSYFYLNLSRGLLIFSALFSFSYGLRYLNSLGTFGTNIEGYIDYFIPWMSDKSITIFLLPIIIIVIFFIIFLSKIYKKISISLLEVELDSRLIVFAKCDVDLNNIIDATLNNIEILKIFCRKSLHRDVKDYGLGHYWKRKKQNIL